MSNTQRLGPQFKGRAWDDGEVVTRVLQADLSYAEGIASLGYLWDGAAWQKAPGDATNGAKVQFGLTSTDATHVALSASSSGTTTIVNAVASEKIRVVSLYLVSNGTVNVKFQSHTTPTDLTGLAYLIANTGMVLPLNPAGWFETISGEALDINLSAAVAVGGAFAYVTL